MKFIPKKNHNFFHKIHEGKKKKKKGEKEKQGGKGKKGGKIVFPK